MKLDILVIAAHPDDAELTCSGTIASHIAQGKKVGIVDLTRGELGTRGTPERRLDEARTAAGILGCTVRENLGLPDGFFRNDRTHQLPVVAAIRTYRPDIILTNAISDRHPDHGRASALVTDACFLAGLRKVETTNPNGETQEAWRPRLVYHFIQDRATLETILEKYVQKFEGQSVPRPPYWGGFRLLPDFFEFWQGRPSRLHDRISYTFLEGTTWSLARLSP